MKKFWYENRGYKWARCSKFTLLKYERWKNLSRADKSVSLEWILTNSVKRMVSAWLKLQHITLIDQWLIHHRYKQQRPWQLKRLLGYFVSPILKLKESRLQLVKRKGFVVDLFISVVKTSSSWKNEMKWRGIWVSCPCRTFWISKDELPLKEKG